MEIPFTIEDPIPVMNRLMCPEWIFRKNLLKAIQDGDIGGGGSGEDGKSIVWLGSFASAPATPSELEAYYNTVDKKSYVYSDSSWQQMTQDGADGEDGDNGIDGTDGISLSWLGSLSAAPGSPTLNQAYYNTIDKKSYVWDGNSWEVISQDGVDGDDGTNGISLEWLGSLSAAPGSPTLNQAYYNTTDKKSYVYGAGGWSILCQDGTNGVDGNDGVGVPTGGTTGQVLAKNSNTDYDTEWVDQTGGTGGGLQWKGVFDITGNTFYVTNDVVMWGDWLYVSIVDSPGTNADPDTTPADWELMCPGIKFEVDSISREDTTLTIDMNGEKYLTTTLDGDVTEVSAINVKTGGFNSLKIEPGGAERSITFNASWRWIGMNYHEDPAVLDADNFGILSITAYGTTNSSIVAIFATSEY